MFRGEASEDRETSGEIRRSWGESKVGKQVGYLQSARKQAQVWESIGQPEVMAKGTARVESF